LRTIQRIDFCPCGSGYKFKKCCAPYLAGESWPQTAEALMRSRYTAFVNGDVNHLYRTTHPSNDDVQGKTEVEYKSDTLAYCQKVEFTGLTIHESWPPDAEGIARVKLTATYRWQGAADSMTELSEFVRLNENWVYLQGQQE
jgi:SEC-C motif-containing protein